MTVLVAISEREKGRDMTTTRDRKEKRRKR